MKIDKIIKMKNNKYKVIIDGEPIVTYDNVILENNLLYKKEIEKSIYNNIISTTVYYDLYNDALKYIMKRKRSENEVRCYLQKKDVSTNDINSIINKLKDIKLIDDIEYCRSYINDKVYLSKDGLNKIRYDLLNENIPINIIDSELSKIDNELIYDRLSKIIIKRINSNKKFSNSRIKQKILNEMINLGYEKEMILDIINKNIKGDSEIIKKEFIRIHNKLSKKYSGVDLKNRIIQKMASSGFAYEEILPYIKEEDY